MPTPLSPDCPGCNGPLDAPSGLDAELRSLALDRTIPAHERAARYVNTAARHGGQWYCGSCKRSFAWSDLVQATNDRYLSPGGPASHLVPPDHPCPRCKGPVFRLPSEKLPDDMPLEDMPAAIMKALPHLRWLCPRCNATFDYRDLRRTAQGRGCAGVVLLAMVLGLVALTAAL